MRYQRQIDDVRAHIRSLRVVIALQMLVIAALWYGWDHAPEGITLHYPPDLRSGAVLAIDEVPAFNVYAFGYYIFQQLNRWPENGAEDFGRQIYRLSPYLTPRYRAELLADLELRGRRGELAGRTRGVSELPGHGYEERRVEVLGDGIWLVWLDLEITETVKGMTVKKTVVRYPLRVVRHAVDPEANPWQLALDGFGDTGPRRLTDMERNDDKDFRN